jgi:hypothetical protein
MVFKDLAEINKKRKRQNCLRKSIITGQGGKTNGFKSSGGGLSGFRVQGGKSKLSQKLREVMWTFSKKTQTQS